MSYWEGKRVVVCGGRGFVGRNTVAELKKRGAEVTSADRPTFDLSQMDDARDAVALSDVVINLAANMVGGITESCKHAEAFMDYSRLSQTILEAARKEKVARFVVVSSACIYPDNCHTPMREEFIHMGKPAEVSRGYGYAKRMAEIQGILYHEKYGMDVAIARPFNAYGPGDTSKHVIPDLLRKVAADNIVEIWGDGNQRRHFTYISDWVDALLLIAEQGPAGVPVNLASTFDPISVNGLVRMIINGMGVQREVHHVDGLVGHTDRYADVTWLRNHGYKSRVGLADGLAKTIEDFLAREAILDPEHHV